MVLNFNNLLKHKRERPVSYPVASYGRPVPAAVDAEISRNQGSPVALEVANEKLQAPKRISSREFASVVGEATSAASTMLLIRLRSGFINGTVFQLLQNSQVEKQDSCGPELAVFYSIRYRFLPSLSC